jgi:hypothetical protein
MKLLSTKNSSIPAVLYATGILFFLSMCEMIEDVIFPNQQMQLGNLIILDDHLNHPIEFVSDSLDSIVVRNAIPDLNINSVLLSTSGQGFLRRVVSILPQDNKTALLLTRPVSLVDVFSDAEINSQIALKPEEILFLAAGCDIASTSTEIEIALKDFVLLDKDENTLTTDDQAVITGKVALSSSPQVQWKTRSRKLQSVTFTFPAHTNTDIHFNSGFGVDATTPIKRSLVEFNSTPNTSSE